jgi:predicted patatin/cPLA2 family phospholipase
LTNSDNHPVIELIRTRGLQKSQPGERNDDYKLGLAIEGGAMRAVISSGMVTALEYLQLLNVFDAVYGASAGAFNGAYFLAKQAAYGTTAYYDVINNRQFINLSRVLYNQPIVNLDYLIDNVLVRERVLDYKAVLESDIRFNIVASSISKLQAVIFNSFRTREELFTALRASSKLPVIAGKPVEIDGDSYLDAALCESIPIYSAINDGCTHVLVLLTRPEGQLITKTNIAEILIAKRLEKVKKGLGNAFLDSNRKYNEAILFINRMKNLTNNGPQVFPISVPKNSPTLRIDEKRREVLKRGAIAGMVQLLGTITGKPIHVTEILAPFNQNGHIQSVR